MPLPPGDWEPIAGRSNFFQDASASERPNGEPAEGVRVAWHMGPRHYFELIGPFDLNEALRIADSTEPMPPAQ